MAAVAGRRQIGALVAAAESLNLCGSVAFKQAGASHPAATASSSLLREAEGYYHESLKLREKLLSGNDPAIAQVLNSLGEFHRELRQLRKAKGFYKRAHQVYRNSLGEKHYRCAYPVEGLAHIAYEVGTANPICTLLSLCLP